MNKFLDISKEIAPKFLEAEWEKNCKDFLPLATKFALTCEGSFPPMIAFMGGFVSQEIIKAITNKFGPMK